MFTDKVAVVTGGASGIGKVICDELRRNNAKVCIIDIKDKKELALKHFGLNENLKTVLTVGGSLGALTINESIAQGLKYFVDNNGNVVKTEMVESTPTFNDATNIQHI